MNLPFTVQEFPAGIQSLPIFHLPKIILLLTILLKKEKSSSELGY